MSPELWKEGKTTMQLQPFEGLRVLFTGYAPVHFICFQPLYERLRQGGADVYVSGGLRMEDGNSYNLHGLYDAFGVPRSQMLTVDEIQQCDFDILFAANTKMICPRSASRRVQIFHGISFRNLLVRDAQHGADHYFVVGPYMHRRFLEREILDEDDSRGLKIGFMKTDPLVNGILERQQILDQLGIRGDRPVLLYAPTGAKHNSLETMGEEVIRQISSSDEFDLIIKLHDHPKNKKIHWPTELKPVENEHTKIACDVDVTPLMFVADALISDASSVSNEYSLLNRPMVFLDVPKLLDKARKRENSALDLETWGRKGGPIVKNPESIVDAVAKELARPDRFEDIRRQMAADLFYNPGEAVDAAAQWLEDAACTV